MKIKVDWEADVLHVVFDEDASAEVAEEVGDDVVLGPRRGRPDSGLRDLGALPQVRPEQEPFEPGDPGTGGQGGRLNTAFSHGSERTPRARGDGARPRALLPAGFCRRRRFLLSLFRGWFRPLCRPGSA